MTKYCTNCGKPVEDRDVFCSYCGTKIDRGTETIVESTYNIYPKLKGYIKDNEKRMKKIINSNEKLLKLFKKFDEKNEEYLKELHNTTDLKTLHKTQNSINEFIDEYTIKIQEESDKQYQLTLENIKNDLILTQKENKTQIKDKDYLNNLSDSIMQIKDYMNQENIYLTKFITDLEFNASYYTIYNDNKTKLIQAFDNHKNNTTKIEEQINKLEL